MFHVSELNKRCNSSNGEMYTNFMPALESQKVESNVRMRPHSTPATLCWLEKNYELSEGVCIPRNVVYYNYIDFCGRNHMQPVNAASFGKVRNYN